MDNLAQRLSEIRRKVEVVLSENRALKRRKPAVGRTPAGSRKEGGIAKKYPVGTYRTE